MGEVVEIVKKRVGKSLNYKDIIENNIIKRQCKKCNIIQILCEENFPFVKKDNSFRYVCRICEKRRFRAKYLKNQEVNKDASRIYYQENKPKIRIAQLKYRAKPQNKIRHAVSSAILHYFSIRGKQKTGSINKYLPYNAKELKEHIEKQFSEPGNEWMTWENWGVYDPKTWNENDKSTWKWQLDHIIPQSRFKYESMEDEEFKQCWALSNLRPYSAKLNITEQDKR